MTLRLGFVGVGRWARKLAESFRACGAEIVAYDRRSVRSTCELGCLDGLIVGCRIDPTEETMCRSRVSEPDIAGFGRYMPWRSQLTDKSIDALVAVATPDVVTEVALACAAAGKPVMATKPLFDHPERITAPFYVDFWRLWSEAHQAHLKDWPSPCSFTLYGSGPFRSFPGALDYGPHVMAALLDGNDDWEVESATAIRPDHPQGEQFAAYLQSESLGRVHVVFGNGMNGSQRTIWGIEETPTHIGPELKSDVLQRFCQSFLNDVSEMHVDTRLLNLSRDGMRLLEKIREMAK